MCGISGELQAGADEAALRDRVRRMCGQLTHRGPEAEGLYAEPGVALGHRRLKIIDLETGDQPIYNEDGSVVVVLNGEIYNYRELRRDLEQRGHRFSTASDTESIVHLYEEHGVECLRRLEGMFAFALWDRRRRRLMLAVDRLGIKPLVYAESAQGLRFASELRALMALPDLEQALDPRAVDAYFELGFVPGPATIYRGVHKLSPGHRLVSENGNVRIDRYWDPLAPRERVTSYAAATERLRECVTEAVRKRMIADVPLGAFLSGGIDSSIVVGLMARERGTKLQTFSIGFVDQPVLDESSYAQRVAEFNGTDHHAFQLTHADVRAVIPEALDSFGEPLADDSFLPTYLVSRETRKSVTVALSGDGADELFAGYAKYRGELLRAAYLSLPGPLRERVLRPLVEALPVGRRSRWTELARKARRFLDGMADDPADRHLGWMRIAHPDVRRALLRGRECRSGESWETAARRLYQKGAEAAADGELNAALLCDLQLELPNQILTKVDLASMQHALEVRVPFLDHHVVELAGALPADFKLRNWKSKAILKDTFADVLPPGLGRRRKQGFDLPIGDWFKREMRELFHDVVLEDVDPLLEAEAIRTLYERHCSAAADHTRLLWALLVFHWWRRKQRA